MSKHDSWITEIFKKGDIGYHLFGGEDSFYDKLINKTIPREVNRGLSHIMEPFEQIDKTINPVRQIKGVDKFMDGVAENPGDAIAAAVGTFFGGGALGSALGGGAGGAGGAGAGSIGGGIKSMLTDILKDTAINSAAEDVLGALSPQQTPDDSGPGPEQMGALADTPGGGVLGGTPDEKQKKKYFKKYL